MSHPACSDLGHGHDTIDCGHGRRDACDDGRIDGIEQTLTDALRCLVTDDQDGGSNHEADHGVCPLCTESYGDGPDEHQQRGDAVRAGMDAVRLQCRRADAATDPDPVLSNHLVAHCTDHGCDHHDAEMRDLLRDG